MPPLVPTSVGIEWAFQRLCSVLLTDQTHAPIHLVIAITRYAIISLSKNAWSLTFLAPLFAANVPAVLLWFMYFEVLISFCVLECSVLACCLSRPGYASTCELCHSKIFLFPFHLEATF